MRLRGAFIQKRLKGYIVRGRNLPKFFGGCKTTIRLSLPLAKSFKIWPVYKFKESFQCTVLMYKKLIVVAVILSCAIL